MMVRRVAELETTCRLLKQDPVISNRTDVSSWFISSEMIGTIGNSVAGTSSCRGDHGMAQRETSDRSLHTTSTGEATFLPAAPVAISSEAMVAGGCSVGRVRTERLLPTPQRIKVSY